MSFYFIFPEMYSKEYIYKEKYRFYKNIILQETVKEKPCSFIPESLRSKGLDIGPCSKHTVWKSPGPCLPAVL